MIDSVDQFCTKNLCSHVVSSPTDTKIFLLTAMIEVYHQLTGESIQEGSLSTVLDALFRVERSKQLERLMKSSVS